MSITEPLDVSSGGDLSIGDYRLAVRSRAAAVIGRREVLTGKAKFGIFGDGKEVVQIAIAHAFQPGDWRSGYYRDQTWMLALGLLTVEQFFAQLYGHADVAYEPHTGGRNMNGHYSSRFLNADGTWREQSTVFNSAADLAPTGSQMPRTVGLAYASVLYRHLETLKPFTEFSTDGNEVVWATIGNASTSEGLFWESVNAIGVLKAPAVITVYDDGYGISVPNQFQMVKENIYSILKGFERVACPADQCDRGYDLYTVPAWDYAALLATYETAGEIARRYHIPALVHVTEATQPLGHSTSGSHERYKSPERLAWETEWDCIRQFRLWLEKNGIASSEELKRWEEEETHQVEEARKKAYQAYQEPILATRAAAVPMLREAARASRNGEKIQKAVQVLEGMPNPTNRDIHAALHEGMVLTRGESISSRKALTALYRKIEADMQRRLGSHLYSESVEAPFGINEVAPRFGAEAPKWMGYEILNAAFDAAFAREPRLVAFGEDLGRLGDVNQGFRGLQEKYGTLRISDTGIREATILGQAIGLALRGIRPICEIQYLDYLLYALQLMADDLATLHWRTAGGQKAPVIVRTRGHRLEGVWHSGSPMAGILNLVRGMLVLVPRDMTRAVGFYNMLLKTDAPALVVEALNGYRLRESVPENLTEMIIAPGVPEVLREGSDVTLVTYGACVRIVLQAAEALEETGIDCEVIDVQSLLPFDVHGKIGESIRKTARVVFVDEDVPGGTTAYMLQQTLEGQGAFQWLDSVPRTVTGTHHRPAYGSDGDYWSKPNRETIFRAVYEMMREVKPGAFAALEE